MFAKWSRIARKCARKPRAYIIMYTTYVLLVCCVLRESESVSHIMLLPRADQTQTCAHIPTSYCDVCSIYVRPATRLMTTGALLAISTINKHICWPWYRLRRTRAAQHCTTFEWNSITRHWLVKWRKSAPHVYIMRTSLRWKTTISGRSRSPIIECWNMHAGYDGYAAYVRTPTGHWVCDDEICWYRYFIWVFQGRDVQRSGDRVLFLR